MAKSIGFQKYSAKRLLDKLFVIDSAVFIAGGAPRDWRLEKPAKDIDVYIRLLNAHEFHSDHFNQDSKREADILIQKYTESLQELLGVSKTNLKFTRKYKESKTKFIESMPFIKLVYEVEFEGITADLIFVSPNYERDEIISHFDADISKIYWTGKQDDVLYFEHFDRALANKRITYSSRIKTNHPYYIKLKEKFPDFEHKIASSIYMAGEIPF